MPISYTTYCEQIQKENDKQEYLDGLDNYNEEQSEEQHLQELNNA